MQYIVDTHVLLWRLLAPTKLSKKARATFLKAENEFLIPTMALLEIQYLKEIGRIDIDVAATIKTLQEDGQYEILSFDAGALLHVLNLTTTRDPFDRVILGQALAGSHKILTKDRWMKRMAPHLVIY